MDYQNRVAIVTGASSGIGREIALGFARRGARLLLIARREAELSESARLVRSAGAEADILVGDVGVPETAARAVAHVRERFGRLDVLVNNAGISKRKHVLAVTAEDAEETIRTNLLGPIRLVLEALPLMIARREGFIVNVSSVAGRMGNPREAVYSASKFGLAGFSEVLHYDLHRRGIRTILINPGPIATEIWQKLESPAAYHGRKYPPGTVAEAMFTAIDRGEFERTVPRRFGAVAVLKALFPGWVRAGIDRFDPDDPDVDPARGDLDPRRTVR